jgi:hypothetical protein
VKTPRIPILCLLFATGFLYAQNPASPAAAQDAAAQITALQAPLRAVAEETEKNQAALQAWYLAGLEQLQSARAAAGDLDGVIIIKAERDRAGNREQTTPAQIHAMSAPLRKLRDTYDTALKKIAEDAFRRNDTARRKYLADLEALQKRITVSGNIDQALVVKAEKERLIAELVAQAPATPQPATPAKTSPPTPKPLIAGRTKPVTEFVIEALVDGGTMLHVKPDSIFWEVEGASKPGMWDKHNEPTYINGKPWTPRWRPKTRNGPDTSFSTPVPFGTTDLEYELLAVTDRRGDSGIQNRTPTEAKVEGREFIVRIPDRDSGGKWYKFVIRTKAK